MDANLTQRELSVGACYRIAWQTIFAHRRQFLIAVLVVAVPAGVLLETLKSLWQVDPASMQTAAYGVLATGIYWLIMTLAHVYMILLVYRSLHGESSDTGYLIGRTRSVFLKAVLVSFIVLLLSGLGMALLIVPGIMAAVLFTFALYFAVTENAGISDALTKSRNLVSGHFWYVLVMLLAFWIPGMILIWLLGVVMGSENGNLLTTICDGAFQMYVAAIETVFFINVRSVWNDSQEAPTPSGAVIST